MLMTLKTDRTIRSLSTIVVLCAILNSFNTSAQENKEFQTKYVMGGGEEELIEEAEWFMGAEDYARALPIYVKLNMRYPGVIEYKYHAGICYINKKDEQEKATEFFEEAYKKKPNMPDLLYHLGMAHLVNYNFDEATGYFKLAKESDYTANKLKEEIPLLLKNCKNGKLLMSESKEDQLTLVNIGAPINTEFDEYVPLASYDKQMLVYTYKGKRSKGGMQNIYGEPDPEGEYYEDIFYSNREGDNWGLPRDIGYNINTMLHDASIGLSADGQQLFVYKDKKGGDIYTSQLDRKTWQEPVWLPGEINSKSWEGHASLSVDGKTMYFSSDRDGGLGGKDLYEATLQDDHTWGDIRNLGPRFNTKYDEDAPFINATDEYLCFSSKGHNSMGGYDIFFSRKVDDKWNKPVNLGYPVNTPNDDIYYTISPDGERAYFSSVRKGGMGGQDIYMVKPGVLEEKPKLALLKGSLKYNARPSEVIVKVTNISTEETYTDYKSNTGTGNYLLLLPSGSDYKIEYVVKGKIVHTEEVSLTTLAEYVEVVEDFELSDKKNPDIKRTDIIQEQVQASLEQIAREKEELAKNPPPVEEPAPVEEEEIEETTKGAVEETAEEASEETTDETLEETTGEASEETTEEAVEETAEETSEGTTDETLEETTGESSEETTDEAVEETTEGAVEETPEEDVGETTTTGETVDEGEEAVKELVTDTPEIIKEATTSEASTPLEEAVGEVVETVTDMVAEETIAETTPTKVEPETEGSTRTAGAVANLKFKNVLFGFDKSNIPASANKELNRLAEALKENTDAKVQINGHTDHIGPEDYNDGLSLRRAKSVANYLISKGIDTDRLIINGYGESKPIAPNSQPNGSDNPEGRKKNRRTETNLISSPPSA